MILTVTYNPAVDQTVQFDEPLRADTVTRTQDASYDPGGKGINASQFVQALGGETVATGVVGGFTGQFVRESLAAADVATDFVEIDAPTRLNTTALAADGEYKLNQAGPQVPGGAVDELVDVIEAQDPEYIHVAGSLPPGLGPDDIDVVARAGGCRTTVDVTGELLHSLEASYALCTPNRDELGAATGEPVGTVEACIEAATQLRSDGFDSVLATLGESGAILVNDDETLHAEALPVTVVDTVGAGDALVAGYLAATDAGASSASAVRTGIVAASRTVSRAGTSAPSFTDLESSREEVLIHEY